MAGPPRLRRLADLRHRRGSCGSCPTRRASTRPSTTWSPTPSGTRCASAPWCASRCTAAGSAPGWSPTTSSRPTSWPCDPWPRSPGWGPAPELLDLAEWAAWRWAGRRAQFLRTATAERAVRALPPRSRRCAPDPPAARRAGRRGVRPPACAWCACGPAADPYPFVLAAAARGHALVLAPSLAGARHLGLRLRRAGVPVAMVPRRLGRGPGRGRPWSAAGPRRGRPWRTWPRWWCSTSTTRRGSRSRPRPGTPVMSPWSGPGGPGCPASWSRRCPASRPSGGATCWWPRASAERDSWPVVDVVDRRGEDPTRAGLFSERLVTALRSGGRVVCVLNRRGRARLLACTACGETARCEHCAASVALTDDEALRLPALRPDPPAGVPGVRRHPVQEPAGRGDPRARGARGAGPHAGGGGHRRHRRGRAARRAGVRRHRGGAAPAGHAQTWSPSSTSTRSCWPPATGPRRRPWRWWSGPPGWWAAEGAVRPGPMVTLGLPAGCSCRPGFPTTRSCRPRCGPTPGGRPRRRPSAGALLRFPPDAALAEVSGAAGEAYAAALRSGGAVEVLGPSDGRWLVRAPDHPGLLDALAATPRPPGRLRVAVDPLRL